MHASEHFEFYNFGSLKQISMFGTRKGKKKDNDNYVEKVLSAMSKASDTRGNNNQKFS
jgi:hypothetical protein